MSFPLAQEFFPATTVHFGFESGMRNAPFMVQEPNRNIERAPPTQSTRAEPTIVQRMAGQASQRRDPVTSHFGFDAASPDCFDVTGGGVIAHGELGRNRSSSGDRKKVPAIQREPILTADVATCPFGHVAK